MTRSVIIGAGPAGLAAAWELSGRGLPAVVFERDLAVGGLARTVEHKGYRFDIGGHRFFTRSPEVREIWDKILGTEFLERPRLSRIYYRGSYFDYPLEAGPTLRALGALESARIVLSWGRARLFPLPEERTFEEWIVNRFGRRLYETFFQTYTEKVWGMPCNEIGAEWAAQRIKNLDLRSAVLHAIGRRPGGSGVVRTLIDRFHYPRLGPGMLWERCRDAVEARGIPTILGAQVSRIVHDGKRVKEVVVRHLSGGVETVPADHVISSMPLPILAQSLEPALSPEALSAAARLRYRDFLTVVLIIDRADVFPDNWIYVHSPDVRVARVQNFKNWSPDMVPDQATTSLGLEYFVREGDELWAADDDDLIALAARELEMIGLVRPEEVREGVVVRMNHAYPVYDRHHASSVEEVRVALDAIKGLHVVGRNGQHRYNNQDHSMLTGILAARNVAGENHDVWSVNSDPTYLEEGPTEDRLVPQRVTEAA